MGHKLPIRAEETTDSDGNLQFLMLSSDGCVIAETNRPAGFTDDEITAIKNLIVTAVNVMPIVKKILTVLSSESVGDFVYNIREKAAEDPECPENSWNHPRVKAWGKVCAMIGPVLEKLEGVDG